MHHHQLCGERRRSRSPSQAAPRVPQGHPARRSPSSLARGWPRYLRSVPIVEREHNDSGSSARAVAERHRAVARDSAHLELPLAAAGHDPRTRDTQMGGEGLTSWKGGQYLRRRTRCSNRPSRSGDMGVSDGDDATAMADFLNARVGGGEEIAWVEVVPLARELNKKALRYLDCWAELAGEMHGEDERAE